MEKHVVVREAVKEDCADILGLIKELADYEGVPDGPKLDCQVLEKDGFNTEKPLFKCYVALCDGQIVGHALYFYMHTLNYKFLFVEDLYVKLNYRRKGIGNRLFDTVAKKTFDEKCKYMDFTVLNTNPALNFYKSKGSIDMTLKEGWNIYRFNNIALQKLASNYEKNTFEVREAKADELDAIRRLSKETCPPPRKNETDLNEISIINEENKYEPSECGCLYAISNNEILGYIVFCNVYSSWEGNSMSLQDLYTTSPDLIEVKNNLLFALAKKALTDKCIRIRLSVSDEALAKFYLSHGASNLTDLECLHLFRLYFK